MKFLQKLGVVLTAIVIAIMIPTLRSLVYNMMNIDLRFNIPSIIITQVCFLFWGALYLVKNNYSLKEFGFCLPKFKYNIMAFIFGTIGSVISLIIMIIVMVIGNATGVSQHPATTNGFLLMVIQVWILASFCEEVFYRGFVIHIFSSLKGKGINIGRHININLPITISAILFGLSHTVLLKAMIPQMVIGIVISTTLLGFVAGVLREKSKSILPAYITHLMWNIVGYLIPTLLQLAQ